MKKYAKYILPPVLMLLALGSYFFWKYSSFIRSTPFVNVTIESQHPSIQSLKIGDKEAWGRLLSDSMVKDVKLIYSNPNIVVSTPLNTIHLIITDKEQNSTRLEDEKGNLFSTTGYVYDEQSSSLTINIHIPSHLVSDEQINQLVSNAIWAVAITNEKNPIDQTDKVVNFQQYLASSKKLLVEDIRYSK